LWELIIITSEITPLTAAPTPAPITVLFAVLPGMVKLDVRHPGGGPVQPAGRVLVIVLGC